MLGHFGGQCSWVEEGPLRGSSISGWRIARRGSQVYSVEPAQRKKLEPAESSAHAADFTLMVEARKGRQKGRLHEIRIEGSDPRCGDPAGGLADRCRMGARA